MNLYLLRNFAEAYAIYTRPEGPEDLPGSERDRSRFDDGNGRSARRHVHRVGGVQ